MTLHRVMSDVGDLSDYYWRLLTNIDMGNAQPFGFWTLVSLFCILSGLALMYLTVLIWSRTMKQTTHCHIYNNNNNNIYIYIIMDMKYEKKEASNAKTRM